MRRLLTLLAAVWMLSLASSASAQANAAIVFVDPADGVQKVRVPTQQAEAGRGIRWAITTGGTTVAYDSNQEFPSDRPGEFRVFAFFQFNQAPRRRNLSNPLDPYVFVYEEVESADGGSSVQRIALKWADWEEWNERQIQNLLANPPAAAGADGVGGAPAAGGGPGATQDPRAWAEWTHFYLQYDLWRQYIFQEVFSNFYEEISMSAPQPGAIRELLPAIYAELLNQRDFYIGEINKDAEAFVRRLQERREARERYAEWRREQQVQILEFAEVWKRRVRGTEVVVEGRPFIISGEALASPPRGRIPIVNPSERLTPYDILTEDGEMVEYYEAQ